MLVFSKELVEIDMLSPDQSEDPGFRSAILCFETPAGAMEAKRMLQGETTICNNAKIIVELLRGNVIPGREPSSYTLPDVSDASSASSFQPVVTTSSPEDAKSVPSNYLDNNNNKQSSPFPSQYPLWRFPPVNPADQNPPCNTLYVGNLPIDASEEELIALFSQQHGYKRLCFRTKQNGPMCFVEFEDVSFATKTLHDLYGHMLHNSVKGGIRLSFSKNPLGVRSRQVPGQNVSWSAGGPGIQAGLMPTGPPPPPMHMGYGGFSLPNNIGPSYGSQPRGGFYPSLSTAGPFPGGGPSAIGGWGGSLPNRPIAPGNLSSVGVMTGTSSGYRDEMMGK